MSDNPLQQLIQTFHKVSNCIHTHFFNFIAQPHHPSPANKSPLFSISLTSKGKSAAPVTKEELGRATWIFLHTLAAQMAILSRMYPCKECADHFKEVLRANPVQAGSRNEFSQWLCHVHNIVDRSLGKLVFPCERVDARWGKLECEQRACDLQGTTVNSTRD